MERWTLAWLALCVALAVHVADEALNGSFAFYNDAIQALREIFPGLPLPTFRFDTWIINVGGAVAVLTALTWLVHRRNPLMWPASFVLALFATANAMLHLLSSLAWQQIVPGALTAPLLLAAALFLIVSIPSAQGAPVRA